MLHEPKQESEERPVTVRRFFKKSENIKERVEEKQDSVEDVNIGDIEIFEDIEKEKKEDPQKRPKFLPKSKIITTTTTLLPSTRLDKSMTKLEKAINGAAMLRVRSNLKVLNSFDIHRSSRARHSMYSIEEHLASSIFHLGFICLIVYLFVIIKVT